MQSLGLTEAIQAAANGSHGDIQEEHRQGLLAACGKLKGSLETPLEAVQRIAFSALEPVALRLAIDMNIFDAAAAIGDGSFSLAELLAKLGDGVDLNLVAVRVMRLLAGMGIFQETAADNWKATPLVHALVSLSPLSKAIIHLTSVNEVISQLPTYFEKTGYKDPQDAHHGPFQYARRTDLHYFDWLKEHPKYQDAFNTTMGFSRVNRGEDWFEIFPVEAKLGNVDPSQTLLVDIGGGIGHDLVVFKNRFPNLSGKLILQDLPTVVEAAGDLPTGIEAIGYDFFNPQPVTGAKVYYLRTVLHDWPDQQARKILAPIRAAMSDEYSILLVNENILPDEKVSLYAAELDLHMMAAFSSLDRTLGQFKELLDSAGFDVVGVWRSKVVALGPGTLLECVVKK